MITDKNTKWDAVRACHKEMVAKYREVYHEDNRSNGEILECIRRVKKDERYRNIMVHWAVSKGGFSEEELFRGRLKNT